MDAHQPKGVRVRLLLFGWEFTRLAMEVGAKLSLNDLEAGSYKMNSWRPGVLTLREANRARAAAPRTPYFFIPLIGHWGLHH